MRRFRIKLNDDLRLLPWDDTCPDCERFRRDIEPGLLTWLSALTKHFEREHGIVLSTRGDDEPVGFEGVATCVFCTRINTEKLKLHGDGVLSCEPLRPVTVGHRLFVPREHAQHAAVYPHLTGRVFAAASSWGGLQAEPFNLITSAGSAATQTVEHLHVHYVPRSSHDGLLLPWTLQDAIGPGPALNEQFFRVYHTNPTIHAIFTTGHQAGVMDERRARGDRDPFRG